MTDDHGRGPGMARPWRGRAGWLALACATLPASAFANVRPAPLRVPLHFEANAGQADPRVRFVGRGAGLGLFLTSEEALLVLPRRAPGAPTGVLGSADAALVRLKLVGGRPASSVEGAEPLAGRSHFLRGQDPARWRRDVPQFARVVYGGVYPGIDLAFHGARGRLEYDFIVAPGADPRAIRIRFEGTSGLRIEADGDLVLDTPGGTLVQPPPVVYQEQGGGRTRVAGRYVLRGKREVGFQVAAYDRARTLVIDPFLDYSTYFGGNGWDGAEAIKVDAAGNMYVAGWTLSSNFPLANPIQPGRAGDFDAFVSKLDATGSTLLFSTYLGGSDMDLALSLALDGAGNVYLAGLTDSTNWPTAGPVQAQSGGGQDAFVAKIAASGSALLYSTYLGGSAGDRADGVAVDSAGNAYVAGSTLSTNFPTASPLQPANAGIEDAFVTKLNPTGSALVYSTYLGGTIHDRGFDVAADAAGSAYVAGYTVSSDFPTVAPLQPQNAGGGDAFVARLNAAGSALTFSTYLGGTDTEYRPVMALDAAANIYVAGETFSADFPTRRPLQAGKHGGLHGFVSDGFLSKIQAGGSALVFSTYLGGERNDVILGVAVDAGGHAYVVGDTGSSRFPVVAPVQERQNAVDAFVAKLDAQGAALIYSTYLGGETGLVDAAAAIAVDAGGTAYVAGRTDSEDFPVVSPFQAFHAGFGDAFFSRLAPSSVPRTMAVDVQPAGGSNGNGVLEPGETVTAAPSWLNDRVQAVTATGTASFTGPGTATYTLVDDSADYGTLPPGVARSCAATGDCYALAVSAPSGRPAQHWDALLTEGLLPGLEEARWGVHIGGSFSDVPVSSAFYRFVETLLHRGVTTGCAPDAYCPAAAVSREQMAVFVLRGREWPGYVPDPCTGTVRTFADVPATSPYCRWIEELARRAIVAGCGGGNYCPAASVSREQMPVYILVALEGRGYQPPACGTPIFADVPAASPYCRWIEELARRGVVGGCGGGNYCPGAPVSREQMAVFVTAGFRLTLY